MALYFFVIGGGKPARAYLLRQRKAYIKKEPTPTRIPINL